MSIQETLLLEFDQEAAATRPVLERVPDDRLEWRPHEKSMTLGRLAGHIAELPEWSAAMISQDSFDLAPPEGFEYTPTAMNSTSEILERFDASVAKAKELLASTSDEDLLRPWTLLKGGEELFSAPRVAIVSRNLTNHMVHHRGQLTVYLRLNDVPVPQTYGPTADESDF